MAPIRTVDDFLKAYADGQRIFRNMEIEDEETGVSGKRLRNCTFEHCFLFVNFSGADLANSQFISCNIKTADFSNAILAHGVIRQCNVESVTLVNADTQGLIFEENYCYSAVLGQNDLESFKQSGH